MTDLDDTLIAAHVHPGADEPLNLPLDDDLDSCAYMDASDYDPEKQRRIGLYAERYSRGLDLYTGTPRRHTEESEMERGRDDVPVSAHGCEA